MFLIDDRNLGGFPGWGEVYEIITQKIEFGISNGEVQAYSKLKKRKKKKVGSGKNLKMIQLKTIDELRLMRESAQLVSKTLGMLAKEIKPGITSLYLDKLAHDFIMDHGGKPAFFRNVWLPKFALYFSKFRGGAWYSQ